MADLNRLLRPKSVAVIGGGFWCENVVTKCKAMGFEGPIWPVHPKRDVVEGVPAVARISDLPAAPDAVFLGINREASIDALAELRNMGAGGAVVFASGFAEAAGEDATAGDAQSRLLDAAGDMPILGPNCYGFINYLDCALLWPDQHGGVRVDSGVALIAQSSNIAINLTMQARGLPLAYVLTVGNQAQVSLADAGMAVLEDPRVTALGLYIEGFGDIRAFEQLVAQAKTMRKPIVAFKAGKSEAARAATVSHTASLAGGDAASRAFLARLGVPQVESIPELLESLKLFHVTGPIEGNRVASLSCSGGEAVLFADSVEGRSVVLPPLSEMQESALREALGPKVALANPLDYHTYIWNDRPAMVNAYSAMLQDGADISFLILDYPRADRCDPADWVQAAGAFADAAKATGAKAALLATMPENMPEELAEKAVALGLAPMMGVPEAITAVETANVWWAEKPYSPVLLPAGEGTPETLDEATAKTLLSNIPTPKRAVADDMPSLLDEAQKIGFPLVLKGLGIAHKSEAGAVALNLQSLEELREATQNMQGVTDWLVEEMLPPPLAELIIGIARDPVVGYVLTLGAGGVLTELLDDKINLLLPTSKREIEAALKSLRIGAVLAGYRGRAGVDFQKLTAVISAFCHHAETMADSLQEMEINPLMVYRDNAVAADALIVRNKDDP